MKKLFYLLLIVTLFIPSMIFAREGYNTLNLEEALTKEQIEHDLSTYQDSEDKITIYMFRGDGCGFCKNFLTFLNSIVPEYGKYFRLESFEVWSDQKNAALFEDVASFLGEQAGGVPFIVIGDKVFPGYASQYDEYIKSAIKDLYNSEDRYDVFVEMEKVEKEAKKANVDGKAVSVLVVTFSIIGTGAILGYNYYNNKNLNARLDELEKTLKEINNNTQKSKVEVLKETKESKTKKTTNKKK